MNREELERKAKELGIKFDENTSDEDLADLIEEAEEENKSNKDDNAEYWKSEFEKAKGKRDDLRKANRNLKEKMEELENKLTNAPSQDEFKKIQEQFKGLKKFREDIEKKNEEEELKQKSLAERTEISFKKQMDELRQEFEAEREKYNGLVKEKEEALEKERLARKKAQFNTLEGDLSKYANKYKAVNSEQIVKILRGDFDYDEDTNQYLYFVKDNKGKLKDELSIEDRVKQFLEDESNSNLVRSDVKETPPDKRTDTKTHSNKKSTGKYDPNDDGLKDKADRAGLSVEDYIETLEIRDERMGNLKEQNT